MLTLLSCTVGAVRAPAEGSDGERQGCKAQSATARSLSPNVGEINGVFKHHKFQTLSLPNVGDMSGLCRRCTSGESTIIGSTGRKLSSETIFVWCSC